MLEDPGEGPVRIDKWLWAARFFKTRSLAKDAVEEGRVLVGGGRAKPSRSVTPGLSLAIRRGEETFEVVVLATSETRGPASVASRLYQETESSRELRQKARETRRLAAEPAAAIRGGRPTKRDGRRLRAARGAENW